jgi:hypothetical protein
MHAYDGKAHAFPCAAPGLRCMPAMYACNADMMRACMRAHMRTHAYDGIHMHHHALHEGYDACAALHCMHEAMMYATDAWGPGYICVCVCVRIGDAAYAFMKP